MAQDLFLPYMQAAYPCYWLGRDGAYQYNEAAQDSDHPAWHPNVVRELLQAALVAADGDAATGQPQNLPLATSALRLRGLVLLPLDGGLLAVAQDQGEDPMAQFSHLFRNALSNVFVTLPLLARHGSGESLPLVEDVERNCYQMMRAVMNLESANRLENGGLIGKRFDLGELLEGLCADSNRLCGPRGGVISATLPSAPFVVRGDIRLVEQALLNVLRNSLQFNRENHPIHVSLRRASGRALIQFEDTGMGIKPEHLPHIFNPYYSVEPYGDGEEQPGLGLGLWIARKVFISFGGSATAESRFGEGTRISLSLPLDRSAETVLRSAADPYRYNRFSPILVQLCDFCVVPSFF